MTNLYFGIKLWIGAIFVGFFVICLLFILFSGLKAHIRQNRINRYLTSIGYKRELISTAAFGTNHTYGYKRLKDNGWSDIIRDNELSGMSIKQIKKKYI